MAGLIGFAKILGRPSIFNSKCVTYCFTRYMSADNRRDDKPKRPTTHFLMYYKNIKNELDKNNPGVKLTEKVKIASQMYKGISDEERQRIKEQSEKLLEEYKEKIQKWRESLSSEEKNEIKSEREKKNKRRIKKLQKANNMPKSHGGAYTMFVTDQQKAIDLQSMSPTERLAAMRKNMSVCAERWKSLPEAEKEMYTSMAEEERNRYEKEIKEWEQSMIEEGKENLVRKGTLKKHQVAVRKTQRKVAAATKSKAKATSTKKTKSTRTKKTVSKKSGVKSTKAPKSALAKGDKSTPKKKVRFAESESQTNRKDFYSSDSD